MPAWAGRWRATAVQVGPHSPPAPHDIPLLMRLYTDDLAARLVHLADETLLETLAFAEGRLLSIHPFLDFNGRVTRLWLRELLRRLDLPPVDLVPTEPSAVPAYLSALRAGDGLFARRQAACPQSSGLGVAGVRAIPGSARVSRAGSGH